MRYAISVVLFWGAVAGFSGSARGQQVDELCREFGAIPSLDSPFAQVPYVFGRVTLKGAQTSAKFPKVTVSLITAQQTHNRITVEPSGNYCFKRSGNGGTLIVEVSGVEVARRTLPPFGAAQQREDFEVHMTGQQAQDPPAVVSAKFSHPRNEKTVDLYRKAAEAQSTKNLQATIQYLKEIVAVDAADFIAWAQLGSLYFELKAFAEAEAAFRKSIALKPEYTPAWINVGKMRVAQKQLEAAIEVFKHTASLDMKNARAFQLLGETYLQAKQGTLAVEALNEAIRLDPVGMAECHLRIAKLYDLAGAKSLAAKEYKTFLTKVPDHPDRKKLEKYITDNPEQAGASK